MAKKMVLTEEQAMELFTFFIVCARTQLDDPHHYASMRFLTAAEKVRDFRAGGDAEPDSVFEAEDRDVRVEGEGQVGGGSGAQLKVEDSLSTDVRSGHPDGAAAADAHAVEQSLSILVLVQRLGRGRHAHDDAERYGDTDSFHRS